MNTCLTYALLTGAAGQLGIALINLRIKSLLHCAEDLARLPLLLREIFQVHTWFITATLLIFSAFTARFAPELAAGSSPLGRWMSLSIAAFWGARTILQVTYYSASHWRGHPARTTVHYILLAAYSALTVTYLTAGLK